MRALPRQSCRGASPVDGKPHPGRILFVGEAVSLAHVGRPALLARWAEEAGYNVAFACGEALADVARRERLTPKPLPTIRSTHFYARVARGKFFYTTGELEAYVQAELDLLNETRPDLVVGDFRLSLGISTVLTGIPLLSLSNAYWSPAAPCRFLPPKVGWFGRLPSLLRRAMFAGIRPLAFRQFAGPFNQVRRRFGLPALADFRAHYTAGQWCAYADLPGWVPLGPLPEGHFFLGPIPWQPRGLPELDLGEFSHGALTQPRSPLAYVSMGSSGTAEVLPNVLRSLLELNCDIALSGIGEDQSAALIQAMPELRKRCRMAPLFNPEKVLRRAAVTVCHGGSGTIYQSLAAGVPVLSLPGNPDQGLAATAAAAHGAGLVIEPERATLRRLSAALAALLGGGHFKKSVERTADALRRHDTRQRWQTFLASVFAPRTYRVKPVPGWLPRFP